MRVVIFGSRALTDYTALEDTIELARLLLGIEPTIVVEGGEPTGVDAMAKRWAIEHGIPVETYAPDWKRFPKTGGKMRNVHMANRVQAGIGLMARGGTPGSLHMQHQLQTRKLPVYVIEVDVPASVTGAQKSRP